MVPPPKGPTVSSTSSTALKAFEVLALFRDRPVLTTSTCAEALGFPRATAHRLLATLREAGFVELSPTGHYRLGLRLFEIGALAPLRRQLVDFARRPLEELADATGQQVHLAVRSDMHVVYLDVIHGREASLPTRAGQRGPLHATGLGKALLAWAPEETIEEAIAAGLPRFTSSTITDAEELRRELAKARHNGVVHDREESMVGLQCLAAPLRNEDGELMAAISMAGHASANLTAATRKQELLGTASKIEQGVGRQPSFDRILAQERGPRA